MKKYHIMYKGKKTREEYRGYAECKGDYIIFKNLSGGKDFVLNKIFYNGCQFENNVIFIK